MTKQLYYYDSYRTSFTGKVAEVKDTHVCLEETYFYPTSGGQPNDTGTLAGVKVVDVIEKDEQIWHVLENASDAISVGSEVECEIDWDRRFDHMQQHSGQHLVTTLLREHWGIETLSIHIGTNCTIDLSGKLEGRQDFAKLENMVMEQVNKCRPITVRYEPMPEGETKKKGLLRMVTIDGLDDNPCCGTHVRNTGELGPLLINSISKNKGGYRMQYWLGKRAVAEMQLQQETLQLLGESLRGTVQQMPTLAKTLVDKNRALKKDRDSMAGELAALKFEQMLEATQVDPLLGLKLILIEREELALEDSYARIAAATPGLVLIALETGGKAPFRVSLGAGPETNTDCGKTWKSLAKELQSRGGGGAQYASGSTQVVPNMELIKNALLSQRVAA